MSARKNTTPAAAVVAAIVETVTAADPVPVPVVYADPAALLAAWHVPSLRAMVTRESKATLTLRETILMSSVRAFAEWQAGSKWADIATALGASQATASNRIILGALLSQVGAAITPEQADTLSRAQRKTAPNKTALDALLSGAPTGPAFVDHVTAAMAAVPVKKRAARPHTDGEGEGTDARTGDTHAAPATLTPATPAEVIAEATRLITLAAHEGDDTLTDAVRSLTLAVVAYSDAFPAANPIGTATAARKARRTAAAAI